VVTNGDFAAAERAPYDAALSGAKGLPERLAAAQRVLESVAVDAGVRTRFQRRLAAICDALKAPGVDKARCERRLDLLLADLAPEIQAGAQGPRTAGPESPQTGA
jgi:hypothetical protein